MEGHQYSNFVCGCCGKVIAVPIYCGDRFCSICGRLQKIRVKHRLDFLLNHCEKNYRHELQMLTFTVKNQTDLHGMVRGLIRSFRKLRNRQYWKNNVHGGAFVIEVTGRPGNWHAHIHSLCVMTCMNWEKVIGMWRKCTKLPSGYYYTRLPFKKAASYLTKYMTESVNIEQVDDKYNHALKGTRLFSAFGSWYHINLNYEKPVYLCGHCKHPASLVFISTGSYFIDSEGKPEMPSDADLVHEFRVAHPDRYSEFRVEQVVDFPEINHPDYSETE